MSDPFSFQVLGRHFEIGCRDPQLQALVHANWAQMQTGAGRRAIDFQIHRDSRGRISLIRPDQNPLYVSGTGELLHALECEVVVGVQEHRPDLYFVHAAAIEYGGSAQLLVAESGGGKSTAAWALAHHGFRYLSDELAPIDEAVRCVYAYPHALCLKNLPPAPYALPPETFRTTRSIHVPTRCLPLADLSRPYPLAAILFLSYDPLARTPELHSVRPAEASARLYANGLNQLAHPNAGLEAAVAIAATIPSFSVVSASLPSTCRLLRDTLSTLATRR